MTTSRNDRPRRERLAESYAAAGLRLTSQRRVLIEVLADRCDHPTVDQIYSAVSERLPEVSRTTIYRSLEDLTERKLLKRVEHPGSAVRFDTNLERHHHFLCTRCGALGDLPVESVPGSETLAFVEQPPAVAEEVTVLVRGLCASCASARG